MASKRQVLEVPGISHTAPIPMGVKIGNMIFTSGIMGADPKTGKVAEGAERQAELVFQNLRTLLERAGASPANVAHITVFVKDDAYRQAINKPWLEMFPDEHDRPARHALKAELPGDMLIQLEVIAVI